MSLEEIVKEIKMLKARISELEGKLTEKVQEIEELKAAKAEISTEAGEAHFLGTLSDKVSFSGLVEVEAGFEKGYENEDTSDIVLATVELGIEAELCDWATANVVLLWEEDDTEPVDIDVGSITLASEDSPFFLTAGRIYIPFGNFETHMVSDPLTLEIGETAESALQVGFESGGFHASAFVFNGDIDQDGDDDEIKNYGVSIGYACENDNMSLDVGVDWINNIWDSDGLGDIVEEDLDLPLDEYADGIAAHLILNFGSFCLIGEYVGAMNDSEFNVYSPVTQTLVDVSKVEELKAWNIELGYSFEVAGKETTFAIGYQGTDKMGGVFPEDRYIGAVGIALCEYFGLSVEYVHDEDYGINAGGTDDDADIVTVQLALEF
jgi:hypothetical protein